MSAPRTFPCPSCKEIINDSMKECRFCGAPVDPAAAASLADVQAQVNQACSDASYIKTTAYVMMAALGLSLIPFIPVVGWAFFITFLAVIAMLVRWWIKFGGLESRDPDFKSAKTSTLVALVLWFVAMPVWFVGKIVTAVVIAVLLG